MLAPMLGFKSGSTLSSIAMICGARSIVSSRLMFVSEVLPGFQPAFSTFLLRTVLASTQS